MKKFISQSLLLLFAALFCVSCQKSGWDNKPAIVKPVLLPAGSAGISHAMNNFAFDFFKSALENDNTAINKLVSPLSIYLVLSMVYNGADHATQDSIAHALRLTPDDMQQLNNVCKILVEDLPEVDSKVKLLIANSAWYNTNGPQPLQDFLTVTDQSFHATVSPVNFSNAADALNTINKWAADNTNQKITRILNEISPNDFMYLINAVYFKGTWKNRFDAGHTVNENFRISNGTMVSVPFMVQENHFRYTKWNSIQVLELPYSAGAYNMYILLPDEGITINETAASLQNETFQQALADTQLAEINIHVPKWKSTYKMESLRPELAAMGMDIAFTDKADFGKMYTAPVRITKSVHQTFIEVNEEGTEAAAATVAGMGVTAAAPPPVLKINRPFMYVIAEKTSGVILFTGIVNNPSAN